MAAGAPGGKVYLVAEGLEPPHLCAYDSLELAAHFASQRDAPALQVLCAQAGGARGRVEQVYVRDAARPAAGALLRLQRLVREAPDGTIAQRRLQTLLDAEAREPAEGPEALERLRRRLEPTYEGLLRARQLPPALAHELERVLEHVSRLCLRARDGSASAC